MSRMGDGENYISNSGMKSNYISGNTSSEEDPLSALDDFSSEESVDEPLINAEKAMGTEYSDENTAEDSTEDASGVKIVTAEEKASSRQLTAEEIKKIAERNKREKDMALKIIVKKAGATKKKAKPKKKKKT